MAEKATQEYREHLVAMLKRFFQQEAERFQVRMAFLYGSRAHGVERPDSDVDLAVIFGDTVHSDKEIHRLSTDLSVALMRMLRAEANVLPVYVDFRKPMLYYNAIVRGIPVFLREPEGYSRLRNEAIFQMEDFQLFGVKWQLDVAKRNLSGPKYA
ncbi:MAG: nucleotidyltransferase domain-containing protein [Syntrophorhabdales bacterium]